MAALTGSVVCCKPAQDYTPDSDVRNTKVEVPSGELPLGKNRWEWFSAAEQEWYGLLLTVSSVADRRAHLRALEADAPCTALG